MNQPQDRDLPHGPGGRGTPATILGRGPVRPEPDRSAGSAPGVNLLNPRLPARRMRVAAVLTAVLLLLAFLDLTAVGAWVALSAYNGSLAEEVARLELRRSQADALAARYAPQAREKALLERRLAAVRSLPQGVLEPDRLLAVVAGSLPAGARLETVTVSSDGHVLLTGYSPSYGVVEAYVAALSRAGFRYVRVNRVALGEETADRAVPPAGGAAPASPVIFDLEAWSPGQGVGSP